MTCVTYVKRKQTSLYAYTIERTDSFIFWQSKMRKTGRRALIFTVILHGILDSRALLR